MLELIDLPRTIEPVNPVFSAIVAIKIINPTNEPAINEVSKIDAEKILARCIEELIPEVSVRPEINLRVRLI